MKQWELDILEKSVSTFGIDENMYDELLNKASNQFDSLYDLVKYALSLGYELLDNEKYEDIAYIQQGLSPLYDKLGSNFTKKEFDEMAKKIFTE